jgi:FkbM family methyltransferase
MNSLRRAVGEPARLQDRIARKARLAVARVWDRDVSFDLYGNTITLPLSHDLPYFMRGGPHYGTNVGRLAAALHRHGQADVYIDIGANVGDTAHILLHFVPDAKVMCIEGDPGYFDNLRRNTTSLSGVESVLRMVGGDDSPTHSTISREHGTGHVVAATGAGGVRMSPLSELLEEFPTFETTSLLKTDTDGYDFAILAGAMAWLETRQPTIFTEYDALLTRKATGKDGLTGPELLAKLAAIGYGPCMVWDNYGFPLTTIDISDERAVADLDLYSQLRDEFYLDIAIFPRLLSPVLDELRAGEREVFG